MVGLRPIYTSNININTCSTITIVIVPGLLRAISTSYVVTTSISIIKNSIIVRVTVDGLLRLKSTSSITSRHSKTFIIINNIGILMVGGEMAGLFRPMSKTSITTNVEISCFAVVVACTIVGASSLSVPLPLV